MSSKTTTAPKTSDEPDVTTGRVAITLPGLSSTTLSLRKITLMTMHWDTYLVRLNPDVNCMDAWQERLYRKDAITEGFIRPQAQEMALALEDSRNVLHSLNLIYRQGASTNPDQIIKHVEPRIRLMAIQDQYDRVPCEAPLMMWDHLDELTRDVLSKKPTKKQIMELRYKCIQMLDDPHDKIDWETDKEIHRTVSVMNTVLQDWELNKDYPLRFYPYKPVTFDRYSI